MSAELKLPADEAYDLIDRFLRNNLDDTDYATFSDALEVLATPAPAVGASLTDQQVYDKFGFLEGAVGERTYKRIAETAIEIQRAALAAVGASVQPVPDDVRERGRVWCHEQGHEYPGEGADAYVKGFEDCAQRGVQPVLASSTPPNPGAATPKEPAKVHDCRMPDGRCGICGGDWSACGCDGMLKRAAATPKGGE